MVSVGKLAAGPTAGRYYVEQVAQGREDYYRGEGEAPGRWIATGSATLGLTGRVEDEALVGMLASRDPATGELLRQPLANGAVAGFDVTFRAPKSVSVVFGIAEPDVAREVADGHEAAVAEALGYLEREGCRARRGHGGKIEVRGEGFLAAAFRHRASRAGDPLLHTHVVIANATRGPDGRWTALDGRRLYEQQKTAGYLYQAALRRELTDRLGVQWTEVRNGVADVRGVGRRVVEHFSRRRAEILEELARRGERSARAAEVATLATRKRKDYAVPLDRLREDWRARAAEHGLDRERLAVLLLRRRLGRDRRDPPVEPVARRLEGPDGLTRDASTFGRRDVVRAFAEAHRDGARVSEIEGQADAFLRRGSILDLGDGCYTTIDLASTERDLLAAADRRRAVGVAVSDREALEGALAARPTITGEQADLVRALTSSGDGIEVVRAAAGTGKTFALDAAREAWQSSGVPVIGCALAARAACELRDQAGIEAMTIASLTRDLSRSRELTRGGVLIVDEAGMVGTRDLATLAQAADRAGGKLVLVGDDRQLPEIQSGGAYRALADRLGAHELSEIQRQREAWDREALGGLRVGDVELWARSYHDHDRIVVGQTADDARQALVEDWWAAREHGADALIVAHRRADVADLNQRARERMRDAGRLGRDELQAGERSYATGDRVVATRNDRRLDVINGQRGEVVDVQPGQLTIRLDDGQGRRLPHDYVTEHLDHGYASTAHRAQGATVDRAFVLGSDELYREWGYTALSRHRHDARFYVTAPRPFLNEPARPVEGREDEIEAAIRGLRNQRRRELAIQSRDDARERLERLHTERACTHWWQRSARADADRDITRTSSIIERHDETIFEIDSQPPAPQAPWRQIRPVIEWEDHLPEPGLAPERAIGPDLQPDLDMGVDL